MKTTEEVQLIYLCSGERSVKRYLFIPEALELLTVIPQLS
jgi:hypothetical protein